MKCLRDDIGKEQEEEEEDKEKDDEEEEEDAKFTVRFLENVSTKLISRQKKKRKQKKRLFDFFMTSLYTLRRRYTVTPIMVMERLNFRLFFFLLFFNIFF